MNKTQAGTSEHSGTALGGVGQCLYINDHNAINSLNLN